MSNSSFMVVESEDFFAFLLEVGLVILVQFLLCISNNSLTVSCYCISILYIVLLLYYVSD